MEAETPLVLVPEFVESDQPQQLKNEPSKKMTSPAKKDVDTRALIDKLRKKLEQLDGDYRSLCNEVQQINNKVDIERRSLRDIPKRLEKLNTIAKLMESGLHDIEYKTNMIDEQLRELQSTEKEGVSRSRIRQDILHEVCTDAEFNIVSDGVDVKTSEIRRKISSLENARSSLQQEHQDIIRKISDVRNMLKPDSIQQANAEINQRILQLENERTSKNVMCQNALFNVRECQRLIEDLEERETLIAYARKNGLTLLTGTTDELISVCRTHQEKIAEKNRLVDKDDVSDRRKSSFKFPNEPAPVTEEFSQHKKGSYPYQYVSDNKNYSKRYQRSSRHRRNKSSYYKSEEESNSSSRSSEQRYGSGYEYDDETCHCRNCMSNQQLQSQYYEQVRKNDGYTIAAAQSAKKGNSSFQQHRFYNDNGWTKFTNQ